MCSTQDISAVLIQKYMEGAPEDDTIYSQAGLVPLTPVLIIAGLPTGTAEGLQYRLKSDEGTPMEQAAYAHEARLQAATLATGGQPGGAQQQTRDEPTDFWNEKARTAVYQRGVSSSSATSLFFQSQRGPWGSQTQLDIRQTLDPKFMEKNFGHLERDLSNLPDDDPKPRQFGHRPEATELYSAAAAKHVKHGGLLADHYFSGFPRGKSDDPTKNPDEGWYDGAFDAYLKICEQIQTAPKAERASWMLEFDVRYYSDVEKCAIKSSIAETSLLLRTR